MNYLLQRKRLIKRRLGIGIAVFIIVVVILQASAPNVLSGALFIVTKPVWEARNAASVYIKGSIEMFRSKQSLVRENQALKRERSVLKRTLLSQSEIRTENIKLKEMFGRRVSESTVLSAVLSRPNKSLYDTFVIGIGLDRGAVAGNLVLASGNIIIGRIDAVYRSTATVTLFSTPGTENAVMVGPERISATAIGKGGGNFEIKLPRGVDVSEGDAVIFPGISAKVFGIVEWVHAEPADALQTILFKSPVNMLELQWVEVLIK